MKIKLIEIMNPKLYDKCQKCKKRSLKIWIIRRGESSNNCETISPYFEIKVNGVSNN